MEDTNGSNVKATGISSGTTDLDFNTSNLYLMVLVSTAEHHSLQTKPYCHSRHYWFV
ncbi:MAG: hypothetical protein R3B38_01595 [Patescibacteria group bacterium]